MKFVVDTEVVCLITNNDEKISVDKVERLSRWCLASELLPIVNMMKDLDFRREQRKTYTALLISRSPVESVRCFRYHCVHISKVLSWALHTSQCGRQEVQHFLRHYRDHPHWEHPQYKKYIADVRIATKQCRTRAGKILKDPTHPNNGLFIS